MLSTLLALCVRIHRSSVDSIHKVQVRWSLDFSRIAWSQFWTISPVTSDLKHHMLSWLHCNGHDSDRTFSRLRMQCIFHVYLHMATRKKIFIFAIVNCWFLLDQYILLYSIKCYALVFNGINQHIEAETKWPLFTRRHFQMHSPGWKGLNLD